jgi:hypothetical protein
MEPEIDARIDGKGRMQPCGQGRKRPLGEGEGLAHLLGGEGFDE